MKKMLFVVNPNAGMKKAAKHLTDMIGIFNRAGYDVSVYITEKKGDAQVKVMEMADAVEQEYYRRLKYPYISTLG